MPKITATEASRRFSDVLDKVAYDGQRFDVERGGQIIVTIAPFVAPKHGTVRDLREVLEAFHRQHPVPDPTFAEDMAKARELLDGSMDESDPWER